MDFTHRMNPGPAQPPRPAAPMESVELPRNSNKDSRWSGAKGDALNLWSRIGTNVLLVLVALLVAAVAWLIYSSSPATQGKYLNTSKLQAVFLQNGQVYFGNISALNKDYLVLNNIYYLQSSSSSSTSKTNSSNQNVSLIKLGCELHKPYDQMILNTSQVEFWENLQADGKVAQAVAQYRKDNPNGQSCSSTASTNSSTNLQSQTSQGTGTNNQ